MEHKSIQFPVSDSTTKVRMIDTTAVMMVRSETLIEPVPAGHEFLNVTDIAFLVEHESSGRKILFDLGIRKDFWNLPPFLQQRLARMIPSLRVDKDVAEILEEIGIDLSSIDSIVWSHYHWDHTGNVSLFPRSTGIVVGPGLKETPNLLPGFPQNPDGYLAAEYFAGRALTQIDFDKEDDFIIGGYRAHDFFGDGSFYLLDTPGHCIGHMCGLARTTGGPDSTFILMGGDIAHFAGDLRPHPKIPLPAILPEGVLDDDLANFPVPCPCSVFTDHHPLINHGLDKGDRQQTPFYNVSTGPVSSYIDPATSQQSVDTLKAFDASDSVLVCLSHDGALLRYLPTLNQSPEETMNNWKQLGWKSRCHWDWLNELPRKSKPGRAPIVDGYWKNGRPWLDAKDALMEGASVALAKAMEA